MVHLIHHPRTSQGIRAHRRSGIDIWSLSGSVILQIALGGLRQTRCSATVG